MTQVRLERMPQQQGLIGDEDDWTGVINTVQRRRLQNRLNQRLFRNRRRKVTGGVSPPSTRKQSTDRNLIPNCGSQKVFFDRDSIDHLWPLWHSTLYSSPISRTAMIRVANICQTEEENLVFQFECWIQTHNTSISSQKNDQLFVLVTFNVFRALVSNTKSLGFIIEDNLDNDEAISPFSGFQTGVTTPFIPPSLRPTILQTKIPHHPWIDAMPCARLRDNLLRAEGTYDDEKLCSDFVGIADVGIVVWGESWDIEGWEISESILAKWGWAVEGCGSLLRATNYWRHKRGEAALVFESGRKKSCVSI